MAKTPSTINLESKFWKLIEGYKKEHDFSSRNDAIQSMLTEWDMFHKFYSNGTPSNHNTINTNVYNDVNKDISEDTNDEKVDEKISKGLIQIASSMKD